jgi:transcriptional regulator with XRE-family HTH domain
MSRDYSKLKSELLKLLLRDRSSIQISRQMGYSFDQIRRWQTGSKELRWDEFCDLCEVLQIPLLGHLRDIFSFDIRDQDELYFFMAHLRKRFLRWSLRELHEKVGVHPSVMKRYIGGQVFPSMEVVFALLDLHKNILSAFLFALVGKQNINAFDHSLQHGQSQVTAETTLPLASAIEGLLMIEEYIQQPTHDEQWFLDKLVVSRDQFRQTWRHMLAAGSIEEKNGKFQITYTTINTQGATPFQVCKTGEFWSERARQRYLSRDHYPVNKGKTPNALAYRVVPMSNEAMKTANEILLKAYHDIQGVAEDSNGPYHDVRVFLFQHFSVADVPVNPLDSLQEIYADEKELDGSISSEKA